MYVQEHERYDAAYQVNDDDGYYPSVDSAFGSVGTERVDQCDHWLVAVEHVVIGSPPLAWVRVDVDSDRITVDGPADVRL